MYGVFGLVDSFFYAIECNYQRSCTLFHFVEGSEEADGTLLMILDVTSLFWYWDWFSQTVSIDSLLPV